MTFFDRDSLKHALSFRSDLAIRNFRKRHPLPDETCELLFRETIRWMWLCRHHERTGSTRPLFVIPAMRLLDEMWHAWILCTRDYAAFCEFYLGGFVHHHPNLAPLPSSRLSDEFEHQVKELIRYVTETLGPETAICWFRTLPEIDGAR